MERVGKAIARYAENTVLDLSNFFELRVFCFLTGNNDMHLKKFSMIAKDNDTWGLAPAYDLLNAAIVNPDDKEELALTLGAGKNKLNRKYFLESGINLGLTIRQIEEAFNRLLKNEPSARSLIKRSFLSEAYQEKYATLV